MDVILRLQCDDILGGRIDRETASGMVTVATVARDRDGLAVRLKGDREAEGLSYLDGLQAKDCADLLRRIARPDVTVTMPDV